MQITLPVDAVNVPPGDNVPAMLSVPVPVNKSLAWAEIPEKVMLPETVIKPEETDNVQKRPAVPLPGIAILAALNIPVPTPIVLVIAPVVGAFMMIAPETVSVFVPLIVIPLFVAGAFNTTLAAIAAISTVTVMPELITTASDEVGTAAPPQVAVLLQLPVTDAVLVAPYPLNPGSNSITAKKINVRKEGLQEGKSLIIVMREPVESRK